MSRQARHEPQWSFSGASGARSRSLKIAPRNNQEPKSRETRLVCLPCQPRPAACGERLFHHRRRVDEDLDLACARSGARDNEAGELFQAALEDVVIVAVPRIDGDRAPVARLQRRQRVPGGAVIDAQASRWF